MLPLLPDYLLPIAVLAILGLVFPARKEPGKLLTVVLLAGLAFIVGRYLWWRLTETLVPDEGMTLAVVGIWFVFAIELCAWFDAWILYAQLARRTDRSPEADAHEARLRALPPSDLPHVDILIATFNEPLDVLERTIIGARSLDWPADRINVYVLDDGARDWLEEYCFRSRVLYLTREGNEHAKAGNINAALKRTSSEFFMILDADFIPQQNMLYRMMGFFEDPNVGIVQCPHEFFNFDPLQTNLAMRSALPSDQKMFFREIMRGRDGWDCAFCCGSNSITRREAMEGIGGAMPTGSITEDMLLTMAFLREGYITRYLCERLAVGLAPESLAAFFVQRSRWAQGALQMLYLRSGPLGPGLTFVQRVMFMPTHWLTQSLMQITALMLPVLYVVFGFLPLALDDITDVFRFQLPAVVATIMLLRRLAPDAYFAVPSTVLSTLQAFRLLPLLLKTLVKPHGHKFQVTPKGSSATDSTFDGFTVNMCLLCLWGTVVGFIMSMWTSAHGGNSSELFPVVSFWSVINGLILLAVLTVAFSRRVVRKEERFFLRTEARILSASDPPRKAQTMDVSMSGARIAGAQLSPNSWVAVKMAGVRPILGFVRWSNGDVSGLQFVHCDDQAREELIARIFTRCDDTIPTEDAPTHVFSGMLASIFMQPQEIRATTSEDPVPGDEVLAWYSSLVGEFEGGGESENAGVGMVA